MPGGKYEATAQCISVAVDIIVVCDDGVPGIIKYATKQTRIRLKSIIFASFLLKLTKLKKIHDAITK
jgi:hypothetical protein